MTMANPFKGLGGGGGNPLGGAGMAKMIEQVQKKMYEDAEKMQERLEAARIEGTAGGVIKAVVDGNGHLMSLTISKDAVDPDDVDTLQELILTAVNGAINTAEDLRNEEQRKLMPNIPGLNLPGLG
jgi:DNA-binding YbaB/EbfC family protein